LQFPTHSAQALYSSTSFISFSRAAGNCTRSTCTPCMCTAGILQPETRSGAKTCFHAVRVYGLKAMLTARFHGVVFGSGRRESNSVFTAFDATDVSQTSGEGSGRGAGNRTQSLRTRSARTTGILHPDHCLLPKAHVRHSGLFVFTKRVPTTLTSPSLGSVAGRGSRFSEAENIAPPSTA
jgi:hypothetical protein